MKKITHEEDLFLAFPISISSRLIDLTINVLSKKRNWKPTMTSRVGTKARKKKRKKKIAMMMKKRKMS